MHHKRKTIITLSLLALVAFANMWATRKDEQEAYKNLQILPKDISKDDLKKIMDGFCNSLGVKCGYCHVFNPDTRRLQPDLEDKHKKQEARDMMKMAAELNSKFFGVNLDEPNPKVAITCYTCHRGEEHPVVAPKPVADSVKVN